MGMVVIQEFKMCLQTAELSLTRKDINLLMAKVDVDGDGCIDYHEFVPICFGILVERFADQVMSSSALSSEDGFNVAILRYFNELDVEGVQPDSYCSTRHIPGCNFWRCTRQQPPYSHGCSVHRFCSHCFYWERLQTNALYPCAFAIAAHDFELRFHFFNGNSTYAMEAQLSSI